MILKPSPGQNKKPQTPPYLHNDGDCHFLNYFGAFGSIPEIGIDQGTSSGNMPSIDCRQIIITSFQRWNDVIIICRQSILGMFPELVP